MAKEAKEKDETRRVKAAKPPQKTTEVESDEELLAATLQLEQLQCGQAEEGHHQHAQVQGQGQGEHQEGGEHHGDRQEGQEQGVEDAQHIPDLKLSIDRAQSPVKWNQGPTGWGVDCADGQVEHHLEGAHQEDHPQ